MPSLRRPTAALSFTSLLSAWCHNQTRACNLITVSKGRFRSPRPPSICHTLLDTQKCRVGSDVSCHSSRGSISRHSMLSRLLKFKVIHALAFQLEEAHGLKGSSYSLRLVRVCTRSRCTLTWGINSHIQHLCNRYYRNHACTLKHRSRS